MYVKPRVILIIGLSMVLLFQNCAEENELNDTTSVAINLPQEQDQSTPSQDDSGTNPEPVGCTSTICPLTTKPAVTTVLINFNRFLDANLTSNLTSSIYMVTDLVRMSSPIENPKILMVRDLDFGMDANVEDYAYVGGILTTVFSQVTLMDEPATGLTPQMISGYDLVWFHNGGWPFSSQTSLNTLLAFSGAVVLQGDDMSWGEENNVQFSITTLTGLTNIDNGETVVCGGVDYLHGFFVDTNNIQINEKFRLNIQANPFPSLNPPLMGYRYDDDLDNTSVAPGVALETLVTAIGGPAACTASRPAITRRLK